MPDIPIHGMASLEPLHPPKVAARKPEVERLRAASAAAPVVADRVSIRVCDPADHYAPAILHRVQNPEQARNDAAVIMISGAGGGVSGPGGEYRVSPSNRIRR
jgi:hypothetical protein